MKVLWVSHLVPYPPRAGVLSRSYNLLRETAGLAQLHLVSFVQTSWLRTFYPSVEAGLEDTRRHLAGFCTVHDYVPIDCEVQGRTGRWRLAISSLLGEPCYTVRWLRSEAMAAALSELARSQRFDLVHLDTISLAPYRRLFVNTPASLGHHNIESHMLQRRAEQEPNLLAGAYFRQEARRLAAYESHVASEFDLHLTCSATDSERLQQIAPGVSVVDVPNGVDVTFFKRSDREPVVHDLVFVGTMDWYPNATAVDFFLDEAWPALQQRRPGITFGIVGSNPSKRLLERARQDPGLKVYGYVDDVRPYFQGATVFVCPIRDGGGTKLKILDALAMQCAVVAHPVACEGINVHDGRQVALAETGADFVQQIESLLDAPGQRQALGQAGRALMENEYSYTALGRRLLEAWQAAAARNRTVT